MPQQMAFHGVVCCLHTVPLYYNFIFTRMILRGAMTILQCILVTCLCGPHLLVSCNVHGSWQPRMEVHVSWKLSSHGSTCMEIHVWWKYTHRSAHVECTQFTGNNLLTESIALHYTNISAPCHTRCHASSLQYGTYKNLMNFLVVQENFK